MSRPTNPNHYICWQHQAKLNANSRNKQLIIVVEDGSLFEAYKKIFQRSRITVFNSLQSQIIFDDIEKGGKEHLIRVYDEYIKSEINGLLIILDHDFDCFLNGDKYDQINKNKNFYYLNKYSIENYFINEFFFYSTLSQLTNKPKESLIRKCRYREWENDKKKIFKYLLPDVIGLHQLGIKSIIKKTISEVFDSSDPFNYVLISDDIEMGLQKIDQRKRPLYDHTRKGFEDAIEEINKEQNLLDFVPGKILLECFMSYFDYCISLMCSTCIGESCKRKICLNKNNNITTDNYVRKWISDNAFANTDIKSVLEHIDNVYKKM